MKKYDTRHIIFHVLLALYFIWLPLLIVLIILLAYYQFSIYDTTPVNALLPILFINLIFGSLLMFLLRILSINKKAITFVRITFYVILVFSLIVVIPLYLL